jgi:hypothetical protein
VPPPTSTTRTPGTAWCLAPTAPFATVPVVAAPPARPTRQSGLAESARRRAPAGSQTVTLPWGTSSTCYCLPPATDSWNRSCVTPCGAARSATRQRASARVSAHSVLPPGGPCPRDPRGPAVQNRGATAAAGRGVSCGDPRCAGSQLRHCPARPAGGKLRRGGDKCVACGPRTCVHACMRACVRAPPPPRQPADSRPATVQAQGTRGRGGAAAAKPPAVLGRPCPRVSLPLLDSLFDLLINQHPTTNIPTHFSAHAAGDVPLPHVPCPP